MASVRYFVVIDVVLCLFVHYQQDVVNYFFKFPLFISLILTELRKQETLNLKFKNKTTKIINCVVFLLILLRWSAFIMHIFA